MLKLGGEWYRVKHVCCWAALEDNMVIRTEQLKSTALASATYDDETQDLDVTFNNGSIYTHRNVPPEVWEQLVSSGSPGRAWHSMLKDQY